MTHNFPLHFAAQPRTCTCIEADHWTDHCLLLALEHIEINPLSADLIKRNNSRACGHGQTKGRRPTNERTTLLHSCPLLLIPTPCITVIMRFPKHPFLPLISSYQHQHHHHHHHIVLNRGCVFNGFSSAKIKIVVQGRDCPFDPVGPLLAGDSNTRVCWEEGVQEQGQYNSHLVVWWVDSCRSLSRILIQPDDSDIKHLFTVLLYSYYCTITRGVAHPQPSRRRSVHVMSVIWCGVYSIKLMVLPWTGIVLLANKWKCDDFNLIIQSSGRVEKDSEVYWFSS